MMNHYYSISPPQKEKSEKCVTVCTLYAAVATAVLMQGRCRADRPELAEVHVYLTSRIGLRQLVWSIPSESDFKTLPLSFVHAEALNSKITLAWCGCVQFSGVWDGEKEHVTEAEGVSQGTCRANQQCQPLVNPPAPLPGLSLTFTSPPLSLPWG